MNVSLLIFTPAPLAADPALWGDFWQGDVIAPGYTLPALEAAFLRETRLTYTITAQTPAAYLAQLRRALAAPPIRAWKTTLNHRKVRCVAVPDSAQWLIIWLANKTILAGYGSPPVTSPGFALQSTQAPPNTPPQHPPAALLAFAQQVHNQLPAWADEWSAFSSGAQIDHLIQAHRVYSLLLAHQPAIAAWINAHGD